MEHIVNMRDAKTTLSKLVVLAESGETVMLARDGEPIVKLVLVNPKNRVNLGFLKGLSGGEAPPDAFAPLSPEEAAEWY